MLERIEHIQGVGLLHDLNGKKFTFKKTTFLYADNARGKSTLASIFRSAANADASIIKNRATVDGTLPASVGLQFANGHKVNFTGNAWSEARPELLVFDADFIDRNVHSGGIVDTNHRKNLLGFALGEKAVAAKQLEEEATIAAKSASQAVQTIVNNLSGYHLGIEFPQFKALPPFPDADIQIAAINKRIAAANGLVLIAKRSIPKEMRLPIFDLDAIFRVLHTTIDDVHDDAEKIVREHVAKLNDPEAESWLSKGSTLASTSECPFCGNATVDNVLLRAYRTHFNAAYDALKNKVAKLDQSILTLTATSIIQGFATAVEEANARIAEWRDELPVVLASFDAVSGRALLAKLQCLLLELATAKQSNPLGKTGDEGSAEAAQALWNQIIAMVQDANRCVAENCVAIKDFKETLAIENVVELQAKVRNLELCKRRYLPEVMALFSQHALELAAQSKSTASRKTARNALEAIMLLTLEKYEGSINGLLKNFGASFSIRGMSTNFRGTGPRTEYGLMLRGKPVPLECAALSFATALSDGDKRTLAFAFFVASALADEKIKERVVIIDDPMCSLDRNRKHHTVVALTKLWLASKQMIVLGHDCYFVRDLRNAFLHKDAAIQVCFLHLRTDSGGYSQLDHFAIDQACESPYHEHIRIITEFIQGSNSDSTHVAKSIRPLLEGYLHRRFPGLIPPRHMFGQIVSQIRDSLPPSMLCHAQPLIAELNEINAYAGQFHHDTNPGQQNTAAINVTELITICQRTLHIVYKGSL